MFSSKKIPDTSSPLSDFFHNASAGEKKRVYMEVLRVATEEQQKVMDAADKLLAEQRAVARD